LFEVMIPFCTVTVSVYGTFVPALLLRLNVTVTVSPDSLTSLRLVKLVSYTHEAWAL